MKRMTSWRVTTAITRGVFHTKHVQSRYSAFNKYKQLQNAGACSFSHKRDLASVYKLGFTDGDYKCEASETTIDAKHQPPAALQLSDIYMLVGSSHSSVPGCFHEL